MNPNPYFAQDAAHARAMREAELSEVAYVTADRLLPGWEDREVAREASRYVDEADVLNPDETIIWGYGSDHRAVLSFGRND